MTDRPPLTPLLIRAELQRTADAREKQAADAVYTAIVKCVTYELVHRRLLQKRGVSCRVNLGITLDSEYTADRLVDLVNKHHGPELAAHLATMTDPAVYSWCLRIGSVGEVFAYVSEKKPVERTVERTPEPEMGPFQAFLVEMKTNILATLGGTRK
jgi:hypothetical protein